MKKIICLGVLGLGLMGGTSTASAAGTCTVAGYTSGGVFDEAGYLSCLAGTVPTTGSDSSDFLAVGSVLVVIGLAAVAKSKVDRAKLLS